MGKVTYGVYESAIDKLTRRLPETAHPDPQKCWLWPGGTKGNGYGQIGEYGPRRRQRNYAVHRLYWLHFVGDIPPGFVLDHLCLNKRCFNPAHIECIPFEENSRRGNRHQSMGLLVTSEPLAVDATLLDLINDEDAA